MISQKAIEIRLLGLVKSCMDWKMCDLSEGDRDQVIEAMYELDEWCKCVSLSGGRYAVGECDSGIAI